VTELELIIDLHKNSDRQGPGSEKDTLKALDFLNLPNDQNLNIADIGCGSGGQTISIAKNLKGQIIAVDLIPEFLSELNEKSQKLGLADKIVTLEKSMDDLPFIEGEFDLIWSEGAIYNIGFENGLKKWKNYLRVGGYLAVSEITWITQSRPKEIEEFWKTEYPEVDTASNKIKLIENYGYSLVGYFYLSQDSWIETYYKPMQTRFENFLKRNNNSELARKVVEDHKAENRLVSKIQRILQLRILRSEKKMNNRQFTTQPIRYALRDTAHGRASYGEP
jgi:SAM-dependent methyltransferase